MTEMASKTPLSVAQPTACSTPSLTDAAFRSSEQYFLMILMALLEAYFIVVVNLQKLLGYPERRMSVSPEVKSRNHRFLIEHLDEGNLGAKEVGGFNRSVQHGVVFRCCSDRRYGCGQSGSSGI